MVELKIPTVDTFLNYLPLEIGGYVIGAISLLGNVFATVLQLRKTVEMNLKGFHGKSEESSCETSSLYGFNELMSSNSALSAFIFFYLITGVMTKNATRILPSLIYLGVFSITSMLHMMSVQEGKVIFGLILTSFHCYSFIVIHSLLVKCSESVDNESLSEKKNPSDEEDNEDDEVSYIA